MNIEELKVDPLIIKALKSMGFETLTPVQEKTIPLMLEKTDIIAQAPTGTGKTCAYAVPAIHNIDVNDNSVQVLVMCPTRELVMQSVDEIRKVCAFKEGVRALAIYGGQSISRQILDLKKHPQIIIGTPGRIIDHLNRRTLKIHNLSVLVLDEADEMLNMGFREDISEILKSVENDHQTVLFSATMPQAIKDLSKNYQRENVTFIKTARSQEEKPLIKQYYITLKEKQKNDVLTRLLDSLTYKLVLIFCRTKKRVDDLVVFLQENDFKSDAIHGDLKQAQRTKVLNQFKQGKINILVATDVAARGLDIENVDLVINYDLTDVDEYYLHRIGRTGRAKKTGEAYTLLLKSQARMIKIYENLTKDKLVEFNPPSSDACNSIRQTQYLDTLKSTITEQDLEKYKEIVENFAQNLEGNYSSLDVAAALLYIATFKKTKVSLDGSELYINLGSMDGLTVTGLKALICESSKVNDEDIRDLDMKTTYSCFVVSKENEPIIRKSMDGQYFNDRQIIVKNEEFRSISKSTRKNEKRRTRSFGQESSFFKNKKDNDRGSHSERKERGERNSFNRRDSFKENKGRDDFKKSKPVDRKSDKRQTFDRDSRSNRRSDSRAKYGSKKSY